MDKIKELEEKLKTVSGEEKVEKLNDLAFALYNSDPEKTEEYAKQALALAEEIDFKKGIARSNNSIGISYHIRSDYGKAKESYLIALNIYEKIGNRQRVAASENNIGAIYEKQGNYDLALRFYFEALKIWEEMNDKKNLSVSFNNIGIIYEKQSSYDRALEYHFKSLHIKEEIGDKRNIAISYNNIGIVYKKQSNFDRALEYHLKALKIKEKIGDKHGVAASYNNIGNIYAVQNIKDKAMEYFKKALKFFEEVDDKFGIITTNTSIGVIFSSLQNYDLAHEYLKRSLQSAGEIGAKGLEASAIDALSGLYEAQADFEQALQFHKKSTDLEKEIFNEQKSKQIAEMQTKYETEKKEKETEIYKLKNIELAKTNEELRKLKENLEKRVKEAVAEIREKENMLIAQSRLATMGEMIGNIAHQWRQPLTAVGIIVQNYEDDFEDGLLDMKYLEEHSDKVMDILQQMSITIDDFRNFFKPNKLIKEFNVKSIIEKTISFVKESLRLNSIKLELDLDESCYIEGFPNEYSQVILNILNNAKDVIKERNIKIENRKIIMNLYKENGKSILTIADTGGGIPENVMGRIFEPYFTTKDDETGTGLGLYMSKTIVEDNMKGKLTARNTGDGAEFRIEI